MNRAPSRIAAIIAMMAVALPAAAQNCASASGLLTRPLIELYTSEGCDSCPPADRWLAMNFLPGRAGAAATVLAFHVDYWDRLGWKDRFGSPQHTARQYDAMRANGATFVYTPQVLVQGRDVPSWQQGGAADALGTAAKRAAHATIKLSMTATTDALQVRAFAVAPDASLRRQSMLWLAYTDSGHVTDVAAGENRGVRLRHDHVVRSLHGPYSVDAKGAAVSLEIPLPPGDRGQFPVLVAVVQDSKSGEALQTLELPVCP